VSSHGGKRIVVTGASRGIGFVIAHHLAALNARVVLVARDRDGLDRAAKRLPGGSHEVVAIDVSNEQSWSAAAESLVGGGVDGLVTAAGVIGPIGPLGTWDVTDFRATLDVNVTGTLLAIATCLPALAGSAGSVVTLSGGGATAPLPRFDAYAASKAAVSRLTENLGRDLEPDGIRVNAVAPGFIVTEMHDSTIAAGPELVGQAYFDRTRQAIDDGKGDPPELAAELTAFLLSDSSRGISGKLISARWDPWREEPFQRRLREDVDFCTVRRIDAQFFDRVPEE
jgi:3-oxoacyl-[acyl-carrier protein] reductase